MHSQAAGRSVPLPLYHMRACVTEVGKGWRPLTSSVLHAACRKEQLWPHVREFADRGISHVAATLRRLQETSEPCSLYTIHGVPRPQTRPSLQYAVQRACASVATSARRQCKRPDPCDTLGLLHEDTVVLDFAGSNEYMDLVGLEV